MHSSVANVRTPLETLQALCIEYCCKSKVFWRSWAHLIDTPSPSSWTQPWSGMSCKSIVTVYLPCSLCASTALWKQDRRLQEIPGRFRLYKGLNGDKQSSSRNQAWSKQWKQTDSNWADEGSWEGTHFLFSKVLESKTPFVKERTFCSLSEKKGSKPQQTVDFPLAIQESL